MTNFFDVVVLRNFLDNNNNDTQYYNTADKLHIVDLVISCRFHIHLLTLTRWNSVKLWLRCVLLIKFPFVVFLMNLLITTTTYNSIKLEISCKLLTIFPRVVFLRNLEDYSVVVEMRCILLTKSPRRLFGFFWITPAAQISRICPSWALRHQPKSKLLICIRNAHRVWSFGGQQWTPSWGNSHFGVMNASSIKFTIWNLCCTTALSEGVLFPPNYPDFAPGPARTPPLLLTRNFASMFSKITRNEFCVTNSNRDKFANCKARNLQIFTSV